MKAPLARQIFRWPEIVLILTAFLNLESWIIYVCKHVIWATIRRRSIQFPACALARSIPGRRRAGRSAIPPKALQRMNAEQGPSLWKLTRSIWLVVLGVKFMLFWVRNQAVYETCISDCMLIRFVAQRLIKNPLHIWKTLLRNVMKITPLPKRSRSAGLHR